MPMIEKPIYLKSLNSYNFRHGKENPRVIGFVLFTPVRLDPRPCFKVEYESDGMIDYVHHKSVGKEWKIISEQG